jgi:hypothetical protein
MTRRLTFTIAASLLLVFNHGAFSQAQESVREFQSGARSTFNTRGHPKAKGVELTMAYPSSWKAEEGERPNVVQKFSGPRDLNRVFSIVTILIRSMPEPLSEADARELFASKDFVEALPPNATLIEARPTVIEQLPAGILEYTLKGERVGISVFMRVWSLTFIQADAFIQVQFSVGSLTSDAAELAEQMAAYKPIFMLMANSIVLPKRWTNSAVYGAPNVPTPKTAATARYAPRQARESLPEPETPPDSDYFVALIGAIVVGFFVTWVLGLVPPLLIRFVFIRHPLERKTAFWVAAGSSAFFWVLFRSINIADGDRPGTGFAWILVFFVARWILSRESKRPATQPNQPNAPSPSG